MLSCAYCAYETANPQSFKRHTNSIKHFKCVEKQIKTKEKEAEILKKAEKTAEKEAKAEAKEQERLRRLEAKEQLDLLKYQLLIKEAERKQLKQQNSDAKLAKAEAKQEQKEQERKQQRKEHSYNANKGKNLHT